MKLDSGIAAIVTGGASGLGAATVRALASEGVRVGIVDVDGQAGEALAAEVGGGCAPADVTSDDAVAAAFARLRERHGQERILVNCAGTAVAAKTAYRDRDTGEPGFHPLDAFSRIVDINLIGSFRCAAMSAAGMLSLEPLAGERGVIVNTSSIAAEDGQVGQTAYAASKAGIVGMTLPMARDLARDGIRVNTILPGVFETPLVAANPAKVNEALAARIPNPSRFGQPDEFASLVLEAVRNAYLNAAVIRLDAAIRLPPR